jgi:hypothetical protein
MYLALRCHLLRNHQSQRLLLPVDDGESGVPAGEGLLGALAPSVQIDLLIFLVERGVGLYK